MPRHFLEYFWKETATVSGKLPGIDRITQPACNRTGDFDFDELTADRFPCQKIVRDEAA